jgi:hypothetical protein
VKNLAGQLRKSRRLLAVAATIAMAVFVGFSAFGAATGSQTHFSLQAYWTQPSLYTPGTVPPSAYLQINSTSSAVINYYYIISYNSTNGAVVAGEGVAAVSSLAVFRAYFSVPLVPNTETRVTTQVFQGQSSASALVYQNSILL